MNLPTNLREIQTIELQFQDVDMYITYCNKNGHSHHNSLSVP